MKKFAEFFAGVGLFREGLQLEGWKCEFANDISEEKRETYVSNFGDEDFHLGNVWDVSSDASLVPDDVFMYTASFPCTDLSVAGGRAGLVGKESSSLGAIFDLIRQKKESGTEPKVVVLENVLGFLTSHQGKDIRETVINFNSLGYAVDIIHLDAIHFSAQSRPRVFVIAIDREIANIADVIRTSSDIKDDFWKDHKADEFFRGPKVKTVFDLCLDLEMAKVNFDFSIGERHYLSDIVEVDLPENSPYWWKQERKEKLLGQMYTRHQELLLNWKDLPKFNYGSVYRRMRKGTSVAELRTDGYAGCLRTPRGGSSKQILVRAGKGAIDVRLMTPREYARLQGVRDTFILPEVDNKAYFAMGDAVSVPVVKFLASKVLEPIYQHWSAAKSNTCVEVA
jgi:DNA (cytosine-5)-methyltransferase 1